jgi:hypothetical protein
VSHAARFATPVHFLSLVVGSLFMPGPSDATVSHLTLAPAFQEDAVGTTQTVTATALDAGNGPMWGVSVTFSVTAGPNQGLTHQAYTDVLGRATFGYTSSLVGTDTLIVTAGAMGSGSNIASVKWNGASCAACALPTAMDGLSPFAIAAETQSYLQAGDDRVFGNQSIVGGEKGDLIFSITDTTWHTTACTAHPDARCLCGVTIELTVEWKLAFNGFFNRDLAQVESHKTAADADQLFIAWKSPGNRYTLHHGVDDLGDDLFAGTPDRNSAEYVPSGDFNGAVRISNIPESHDPDLDIRSANDPTNRERFLLTFTYLPDNEPPPCIVHLLMIKAWYVHTYDGPFRVEGTPSLQITDGPPFVAAGVELSFMNDYAWEVTLNQKRPINLIPPPNTVPRIFSTGACCWPVGSDGGHPAEAASTILAGGLPGIEIVAPPSAAAGDSVDITAHVTHKDTVVSVYLEVAGTDGLVAGVRTADGAFLDTTLSMRVRVPSVHAESLWTWVVVVDRLARVATAEARTLVLGGIVVTSGDSVPPQLLATVPDAGEGAVGCDTLMRPVHVDNDTLGYTAYQWESSDTTVFVVGDPERDAAVVTECIPEGLYAVKVYIRDRAGLADSTQVDSIVVDRRTAAEGGNGVGRRLVLFGSAPNPSLGSAQLRMWLGQRSDVEMRVHGVRGELVRMLKFPERAAGNCAIAWDGTDSSGNRVEPGMYFFSVSACGERIRGRVVLLR